MNRPVWVSAGSPAVRAMPKSLIFATPSSRTSTLPGLTSRWVMPAAWAEASPSATWAPIAATRSGGSAPSSRIRSDSDRDGTFSITIQMCRSSSTTSKTVTTLRWLSAADDRASRSARAESVTDSPGSSPTCFTATSRVSFSSRHSHTVPMPPCPIALWTR